MSLSVVSKRLPNRRHIRQSIDEFARLKPDIALLLMFLWNHLKDDLWCYPHQTQPITAAPNIARQIPKFIGPKVSH